MIKIKNDGKEEMNQIRLSESQKKNARRNCSNHKTPRIDKMTNYWLKKLDMFHKYYAKYLIEFKAERKKHRTG